jgi:hypothetical protein
MMARLPSQQTLVQAGWALGGLLIWRRWLLDRAEWRWKQWDAEREAEARRDEGLKDDASGTAAEGPAITLGLKDECKGTAAEGPAISFMGCGTAMTYGLGVASYLQANFELSQVCFFGSSAGAVLALMASSGIKLGEPALRENIRLHNVFRGRRLGPLGVILPVVNDSLMSLLAHIPDDELQQRIRDRCCLSLTHVPTMGGRILRHFSTKQDLVDAAMMSGNLPLFMCAPRLIQGDW